MKVFFCSENSVRIFSAVKKNQIATKYNPSPGRLPGEDDDEKARDGNRAVL
jgi:hypothetical protein